VLAWHLPTIGNAESLCASIGATLIPTKPYGWILKAGCRRGSEIVQPSPNGEVQIRFAT